MCPATTSNQITLLYYRTLLEMGRRNEVQKVERRNGGYVYFTYHLISKR